MTGAHRPWASVSQTMWGDYRLSPRAGIETASNITRPAVTTTELKGHASTR